MTQNYKRGGVKRVWPGTAYRACSWYRLAKSGGNVSENRDELGHPEVLPASAAHQDSTGKTVE